MSKLVVKLNTLVQLTCSFTLPTSFISCILSNSSSRTETQLRDENVYVDEFLYDILHA